MVNITKSNFIEVHTWLSVLRCCCCAARCCWLSFSAATTPLSSLHFTALPPSHSFLFHSPLCFYISQQSNDLLRHLPTASFVAIDEEMTGISLPGSAGRPRKDRSPSQRYVEALKQVPERYSIIQLGVALFHAERDDDGDDDGDDGDEPAAKIRWKVRTYNFYMFPDGGENGGNNNRNNDATKYRELVLNPGAVAFLNKHNMSFDMWTKQGVSYLTREHARDALRRYLRKERLVREGYAADDAAGNGSSGTDANGEEGDGGDDDDVEEERTPSSSPPPRPSVQESLRRRVELVRPEDIQFNASAMAGLREWLDNANSNQNGGGAGRRQPQPRRGQPLQLALNGRNSFLLPPCNSFLRRALYENIEKEYPNLILEKSPDNPNQIRVLRLNQAEKLARRERLRREAWEAAVMEVGMFRVVDALRRACNGLPLDPTSPLFAQSADDVDFDAMQDEEGEYGGGGGAAEHDDFDDYDEENEEDSIEPMGRRKIPIVVHNGFMDLLFLMTHFHSHALPDTLPECKTLINSYFPVVYDTKVMASECSASWNNEPTILATLFEKIVSQNHAVSSSIKMVSDEEEDGEVVEDVGQEHQADYDAYMTGSVFIGISQHIRNLHPLLDVADEYPHLMGHEDDPPPDDTIRTLFGRGKLFQMSMFTLDLESPYADPLQRGMSLNAAYRVSRIDPSVSTRDIVNCMNGLVDSHGRRVNFDIVWVDDTTFVVAARYRPSESAVGLRLAGDLNEGPILNEHGHLLSQALRNRFSNNEKIVTLEEHFRSLRETSVIEEKKEVTWYGRLLQHFGITRARPDSDHDGEPAAKRRRQQ